MPNQYGNAYGNNSYNNAMPNQYMSNQYNTGQYQTPKKKSNKTIAPIVVLAIVLPLIVIGGFIAVIFGIVNGVLNEVKESEEYNLAYSYVVNSNIFDKLDVDESEIKLTGYQSSIVPNSTHGTKKEFIFSVDGYDLIVVCHETSEGEWAVCYNCTTFD